MPDVYKPAGQYGPPDFFLSMPGVMSELSLALDTLA